MLVLRLYYEPCPLPPPSPRSGHSATLVGRDHLVIFGDALQIIFVLFMQFLNYKNMF